MNSLSEEIDAALEHCRFACTPESAFIANTLTQCKSALERNKRDGGRYRWIKSLIHGTWATEKGTHFSGDKFFEIVFDPPGIIYVYQNIGNVFDTAVDSARAGGQGK